MELTLEAIQGDEALRRREFPVVEKSVFLAHAGVCPLPRRVTSAIAEYLQGAERDEQESSVMPALARQVRQLAARLVEADADEIALVGPTSLGLSMVASGLSFEAGDNIVAYWDDYPSNVYPWLDLSRQGVEVRFVQTRSLGRIELEDVAKLVDERTRLAALASCHFIGGCRLDLPAVGSWLRDRGVLFCVDGIQTAGAFPTLAQHCDFIAADAHKWLLGPCAAGIVYVRREVQERLRPPWLGWNNVICPEFVAQPEARLRQGARRYEAGSHNLLGLVGLKASLELILEIGVDRISADLLRKRARLIGGLEDLGFQTLHADLPPERGSGIVSFYHEGDMAEAHGKLAASEIAVSLRTDRQGRRYLRASPHFYNTDDELDRLVGALRSIACEAKRR